VGSFTVTNPSQSPRALLNPRKPSNRSHRVERVMRPRAKGSPRWHSAHACSPEHRYRWCRRVRKRSTAATASAGFGSSTFRLRLPHHLQAFPAMLALLLRMVLRHGSCCRSNGRRSAPATQQDRPGCSSQASDRYRGQCSQVRLAHPCATTLANSHCRMRCALGFHQTEIAIHLLYSSVASVLVAS
jgi:hypothetical protein